LGQFKSVFQLAKLNKCTNPDENCEQRCFRHFYPKFNNFVPPLHNNLKPAGYFAFSLA